LEDYGELFQKLTPPNGSIKVLCEVAEIYKDKGRLLGAK